MKIPLPVHIRVTWFLIAICLTAISCTRSTFVKRTSSDAAKESRLNWNYKTTVDAYQKAGFKSYKWNAAAIKALAEFAISRAGVIETNEPWAEIISTNAAAAVRAGCNDPMVNYLFIKFAMAQTNSKEAFADAFGKMAGTMANSLYPPVRKFYAAARAMDQIFYTYGTNSQRQSDFGTIAPMLSDNLNATLADKTMPAREAYEVADTALALAGGKNNLEQLYQCIQKPLFDNWPSNYTTWLFKGSAYIKMAWAARGGGYADTVSEEGWRRFKERLATAETALNHAWALNPKDPQIAVKMMWVELGQGQGRDRLELWFRRAMELDPNDYDACSAKCLYLEPKWYGSIDEMLSFGRECVQNKKWGGRVPLILVDAHCDIPIYYLTGSAKTNYWTQPQVWPDIQAAYERFFELNPDATDYYHNYVWYAYKCEQWDKLNELIPKLGPVNYDYFGGKDEFDKMVQLAKEHAGEPK